MQGRYGGSYTPNHTIGCVAVDPPSRSGCIWLTERLNIYLRIRTRAERASRAPRSPITQARAPPAAPEVCKFRTPS